LASWCRLGRLVVQRADRQTRLLRAYEQDWTTLTALAPVTEHVKLAYTTLCYAFRHPSVLAKMRNHVKFSFLYVANSSLSVRLMKVFDFERQIGMKNQVSNLSVGYSKSDRCRKDNKSKGKLLDRGICTMPRLSPAAPSWN